METIGDGTGKSFEAKVDGENRLHTLAISEGFNVDSAVNGKNYNFNTGDITLTSASKSAIAYIKNLENDDLIIRDILIISDTSTGGSGDFSVEIIRNPTTGTIISGATDFSVKANRNFGSVRDFVGDVFKGAEANTLTNGENFSETSRSTTTTPISFDADVIILPKGASLGVNYTPQTGNTSQVVKVAIVGFLFSGK